MRLFVKNRKLWILGVGLILALSGCSEKVLQWDSPPEMAIDPAKIYLATLKTEQGDIQIELFADKAPITVNSFIFLANEGFFDDTTFYRVIPGFMAQAGDPTAVGNGGPGYNFEDEFHPSLKFDDAGYLGMANRGPGTNGSQFFITYTPQPNLTGLHTIFGKVVEGMDAVLNLTPREPDAEFVGDALLAIEIEEIPESILPPPTPTPIPVVPEPEAGRPLAALGVTERENLYTGMPEMHLDRSKTYRAIVETSKGEIIIALNHEVAPESVNNFVVLADLGYYDGFPIAFVDPETFILTGSPKGDPFSDIGYSFPREVNLANVRGAVGVWVLQQSMTASGSQFYILVQDVVLMDTDFPVFGEVVEGMDVVDSLTVEDRIEIITIEME